MGALDTVKAHGPWALVVYHVLHYAILALTFAAAYALGADATPVLAYVGAADTVAAMAGEHSAQYMGAWACATVTGKVAIPLKVWLTVKLTPRAEGWWRGGSVSKANTD